MVCKASIGRLCALVAGAVFVLALAGAATAGPNWPNWKETGNSRAAKEAKACVRPTDWMRRNHMELIEHDRDLTVLEGVRTVDGSISKCIACHANKDQDGDYIPVNAEEQFCADCHEYVAVSPDCFECHKTVPEK